MHLIHRHHIDFKCSSKSVGFEVQKQCGDLVKTELYPAIDKLFSRFDYPDIVWAIGQVEINIHCNPRNWRQALVQETLLQLEEFLKNASKPTKIEKKDFPDFIDNDKITTSEYCFTLFLSFLKNGILPINAISSKIKDIIESIVWVEVVKTKLFALLTENPAVLLRFILTTPDEVKSRISEQFLNKIVQISAVNQLTSSVESAIQRENPKIQRLLLESFFLIELFKHRVSSKYYDKLFAELTKLFDIESIKVNLNILLIRDTVDQIGISEEIVDKIYRFVENWSQTAKVKKTGILPEIDKNRIIDSNIDYSIEQINHEIKAVFIENAGLIILHPFLESLFSNLGLCENKKWMNTESQHKAVLVMQYLCTGNEEFWNSNLFLNKMYCGFTPDSVINTFIEMTDDDKTQCNEMLTAVIGHWSKLGNTSIEGLRETFLRRKGKVALTENELILNVESSGVDILLEHLPWSIRIVKSPWLDKIINCNWEY